MYFKFFVSRISNLHQISAELTETDFEASSESSQENSIKQIDFKNSFKSESDTVSSSSSFGTTDSENTTEFASPSTKKQVGFKIVSDIEVASE